MMNKSQEDIFLSTRYHLIPNVPSILWHGTEGSRHWLVYDKLKEFCSVKSKSKHAVDSERAQEEHKENIYKWPITDSKLQELRIVALPNFQTSHGGERNDPMRPLGTHLKKYPDDLTLLLFCHRADCDLTDEEIFYLKSLPNYIEAYPTPVYPYLVLTTTNPLDPETKQKILDNTKNTLAINSIASVNLDKTIFFEGEIDNNFSVEINKIFSNINDLRKKKAEEHIETFSQRINRINNVSKSLQPSPELLKKSQEKMKEIKITSLWNKTAKTLLILSECLQSSGIQLVYDDSNPELCDRSLEMLFTHDISHKWPTNKILHNSRV